MGISVFGKGVARLCAVVATAKAAEFIDLVRSALKESPTIELRLDWLANDRERNKVLRWLRQHAPRKASFIATCRRSAGGGEYAGGPIEELEWLEKATEAGCAWSDLEIETLRELPGNSIRGRRLQRVMLSIHDFRGTPTLPEQMKPASRGGFAAVKVAAMSRKLSDSLRVLHLARGTSRVVAVPMGEIGLPARILALRQGSALLYAPVGSATAPGQISLHDLKKLYRAHELTARTRVFGVIGSPIGHSLSPLLHNVGYVAAKKNAVYVPFLVEKLQEFLSVVKDFGVAGFSVTIPHKQKIFKYLDECDPSAEEIGAVNTVTVGRNGQLAGSNTDYVGVLRALEGKLKLKGSRVLIYGSGGSARAAAFAMTKAEAEVLVCARRQEAAKELAAAVGGSVIKRRALRREKFDALINTTPVGMYPHEDSSPLDASELNCRWLMDLIYRPMKTRLLRMAERRRIHTVSGVEMFLAQGIAQWELWMGSPAPEAAMRRAILRTLVSEERQRR